MATNPGHTAQLDSASSGFLLLFMVSRRTWPPQRSCRRALSPCMVLQMPCQ